MRERLGDEELLAAVRPEVRELTAYYVEPHDVEVKLDQNENAFGMPEPISRSC